MIARFAITLVLLLRATASLAEESEPDLLAKGRTLAERMCSGCHAVGASGQSPHPRAPPFRAIDLRVKLDSSFVDRLRKGLIVGDPDMPQFRFSDDSARALVLYLRAIQSGIVVGPPVPPPSAETRITSDLGGKIDEHVKKFRELARSGARVVIDGSCESACTLVLGIIPFDHLCVTPRASFGFHAAIGVDDDGRPVSDPVGTQYLLDKYPKPLRDWIVKNGGLTAHIRYVSGTQLRAFIPICIIPSTATGRGGRNEVVLGAPSAARP